MFSGQHIFEDEASILCQNVTNQLPRDMASYPRIMGPQQTEGVGSRFLWKVSTYLPKNQETIILELLYFIVFYYVK
jgi:hypothetical protein